MCVFLIFVRKAYIERETDLYEVESYESIRSDYYYFDYVCDSTTQFDVI